LLPAPVDDLTRAKADESRRTSDTPSAVASDRPMRIEARLDGEVVTGGDVRHVDGISI
jgi:hypothetical protein